MFGLMSAADQSRGWQENARMWRIAGHIERACQVLADYFAKPLWHRFIFQGEATHSLNWIKAHRK